MSSTLRITGLATGLDVDNMVKTMMKAENMRMYKLKQNRQLVEWKQNLYRDILGDMNTFKSTYFDVLKSDSYMLSEKNYSNFTTKTSDSDSTFSATASSGAISGNYKVYVTQIAQKAQITGSEINIKESAGFSFPANIDLSNDTLNVSIDGTQYNISLEHGSYKMADLVSKINSKLPTDGTAKVKAVLSSDGSAIKFESIKDFSSGNQSLQLTDGSGNNYTITIPKGKYTSDELSSLINNNLKTAKDSTGAVVDLYTTKGLSSSVTSDGSNVTFTSGWTVQDGIIPSTSSMTLQQNGGMISNNSLEYARKIITGVNDTLTFKINGSNYTVKLAEADEADYGTVSSPAAGFSDNKAIYNDLAQRINNALANAADSNGNTGINLTSLYNISSSVSLNQDGIQFVSTANNTISVTDNASNAANTLGFSSGFDINQSVNDKASEFLGESTDSSGNPSGKVSFTINDGTKNVTFSYDFTSTQDVIDPATNQIITMGAKNKSIYDIANDIASKSNAKLSYSQLTRKFTLESKDTGSSQNISLITNLSETGDVKTATNRLLTSIFGDRDNILGDWDDYNTQVYGQGQQDAIISIKDPTMDPSTSVQGVNVTKPTNSFTIDGITYNLNRPGGTQSEPITLTVTSDPQKTFDKIKEFIDKYNENIDKINTKLNERRQYKYPPLTDDQKKDMKDNEITQWESKAKEGLLANDSSLENMIANMRRAFYDSVQGAGITLSEIGLSTSNDISQRGKIIIDEAKLKDAINNKGDKVSKLFMKTSSTPYNPNTRNEVRYSEEGIFQRINDILQDNLRTSRDNNGRKGVLLEIAGVKGDYSEFHNRLTDDLVIKDSAIDDLNRKLSDKENQYYNQFSKLEAAMQKMNSQSSWLTQQLGGMNGGN